MQMGDELSKCTRHTTLQYHTHACTHTHTHTHTKVWLCRGVCQLSPWLHTPTHKHSTHTHTQTQAHDKQQAVPPEQAHCGRPYQSPHSSQHPPLPTLLTLLCVHHTKGMRVCVGGGCSYLSLWKQRLCGDRKSTRLKSSHANESRMPSSA